VAVAVARWVVVAEVAVGLVVADPLAVVEADRGAEISAADHVQQRPQLDQAWAAPRVLVVAAVVRTLGRAEVVRQSVARQVDPILVAGTSVAEATLVVVIARPFNRGQVVQGPGLAVVALPIVRD